MATCDMIGHQHVAISRHVENLIANRKQCAEATVCIHRVYCALLAVALIHTDRTRTSLSQRLACAGYAEIVRGVIERSRGRVGKSKYRCTCAKNAYSGRAGGG